VAGRALAFAKEAPADVTTCVWARLVLLPLTLEANKPRVAAAHTMLAAPVAAANAIVRTARAWQRHFTCASWSVSEPSLTRTQEPSRIAQTVSRARSATISGRARMLRRTGMVVLGEVAEIPCIAQAFLQHAFAHAQLPVNHTERLPHIIGARSVATANFERHFAHRAAPYCAAISAFKALDTHADVRHPAAVGVRPRHTDAVWIRAIFAMVLWTCRVGFTGSASKLAAVSGFTPAVAVYALATTRAFRGVVAGRRAREPLCRTVAAGVPIVADATEPAGIAEAMAAAWQPSDYGRALSVTSRATEA
jgi:hypothetical protein